MTSKEIVEMLKQTASNNLEEQLHDCSISSALIDASPLSKKPTELSIDGKKLK